MKKLFCVLLLAAVPAVCFGQHARISDIRFEQSGDAVIIHYALDLNGSKKVKNIHAYMHIDGRAQKLKKVSGDVGTVSTSGTKQIIYDIFKENGNEEVEGTISFTVEGTEVYIESRGWIEYEYSKTAPLGFTLGGCKSWGWYFRVKADVKLHSKAPESGDGSYIVDNAEFSTIDFDEREYYRLAVTTGLMRRLFKGCYLYGGLGYGAYGAAYKVVDTAPSVNTAYYCPDLQKGLEVEGGMVIRLGGLSLSGGYTTLLSSSKPRFSDVSVGLGFMF